MNGKEKEVASGINLAKIFEESFSFSPFSAVAVNGVFIPKEKHAFFSLKQGDRVEVLQPAEGG